MTLILTALLLLQDTWEFRQSNGVYVNPATMEQRTPEEWFASAEKLAAESQLPGARAAFQFLSRTLPTDTPPHQRLKERATFESARCSYRLGEFGDAFVAFDEYIRMAPDAEEALGPQGARYFLCQSAFNLAQVGQQESVLGLPMYRSSRTGVDLLKKALQRFPRERFSDDFYLALGEFLLKEGRIEEAKTEFAFILTPGQYDRTNSAPRAQLRLAEAYLRQFDSVNYDAKVLADAKREYEKFLSSWGRLQGDRKSQAALELTEETLKEMMDAARSGIQGIDEKLAEKEWTLAEYYSWKGKPAAAKVYFRRILKDYPSTSWAEKARKKLEDLGP